MMGEDAYCCSLGSAIEQDRVLCRTENFFVIPTLGSMGIEGYLLIVPNRHYHAIAEISEKNLLELEGLLTEVKKLIKCEYHRPVLIFEHGPRLGNLDSGQSVDHAHLHLVPGVDITEMWARDLMCRLDQVGQYYRVERVEGFHRARDLNNAGKSYLFVHNPEDVQLISEQNFHRPAQYFRAMVARQIGSAKWDWRQYPDRETLERTVDRLKGKL